MSGRELCFGTSAVSVAYVPSGPDVSEYQGDVDWKKVASRHALAIARISDGDHRDPWYTQTRLRAIEKAGLLFAPYYFARVASPHNKQRKGAAEARMAIGFARKGGIHLAAVSLLVGRVERSAVGGGTARWRRR